MIFVFIFKLISVKINPNKKSIKDCSKQSDTLVYFIKYLEI